MWQFVELRQLEYFLAVVEEGSFTSAAARLFMVQSSLSSSLLGLERELGAELFIRGRRGAELTDAGRALVGSARAVLEHADRGRDEVAAVKGLLRGRVCIAALAVPPSIDLWSTIRRFGEEHPGVEVRVLHTDAHSMVDLVADGQADFAVTPRTDRMSPALRFEPLISTPLALVCPVGHRLAGARNVLPRDLGDESIIDLPRSWQARVLFDRLLEEDGLQRQIHLEIDDWLAVLTLVQRGMGIAYGPQECLAPESFGGLEWATISAAPLWEFGILTRDEVLRGAAGRALLAAYREHCATALTPRA